MNNFYERTESRFQKKHQQFLDTGLSYSPMYTLCTALHCRLCRVLSKNWEIFLCNPLQDLLLCYVTWCVFGHDIFLSTARANEVSVLVIYHKFPQKALNEVFQLRLGTVEVLELSPLPNSWSPLIGGRHPPCFPGLSLQLWSCSPNPHLEYPIMDLVYSYGLVSDVNPFDL